MRPWFVHRLRISSVLLCLNLFNVAVHAQVEDDGSSADVDQIEAEIDRSAPKAKTEGNGTQRPKTPDPQTLTDLGKLAPFNDVSVLQKRFMPKTDRMQVGLGFNAIMNDPWFNGLGADLTFAYHFSENWGLEANARFLSNSEKDSVKDLKANNNVDTASIVTTKGFYGLDVFWSPIYGKMSLYNKRIVPFDMYFTGGLGQSSLDGATASSAVTYHVGTGQIFALNKTWGFRWDLSYNFFSASTQQQGYTSATQFNNLILTVGGSFFFPEAKYR